MNYFEDKVVVVTGGTDGIGKALVDQLVKNGAKIATCGRNQDKLYTLQMEYSHIPIIIKSVDVSRENECKAFIESVISFFGRIDVLINNAGISMRALFSETELDTLRKSMDVNFWGTVYCTKYALKSILETKGTICGVSSIAGYRGMPGRSGYSASKFAMQGWLEAIRTELIHSGVNVMWVCPDFTASNIRNAALNKDAKPQGQTTWDEGKMRGAGETAKLILDAIAKRKRTLVIGMQGKMSIFLSRLLPSLSDKLHYRFFYNKKGELK